MKNENIKRSLFTENNKHWTMQNSCMNVTNLIKCFIITFELSSFFFCKFIKLIKKRIS